MIVKIVRGIGQPGKLWTGDVPEDGAIVDARIMERTCSCGASTRKLRVTKIDATSAKGLAEACEISTLFVTMGGVGSVATGFRGRDGLDVANPIEFQLWNWSGRVGGHAILNPTAVLGGYWETVALPSPKEGYYWIRTYSGSTLSEFVLLQAKKDEQDGESVHALPIVSLEGTCPPCRHKQEVQDLPEDLMVPREALTGLSEYEMEEVLSSIVHMEGGREVRTSPSIQARLLLAYTGWKNPAGVEQIVAAIESAKQHRAGLPPAIVV